MIFDGKAFAQLKEARLKQSVEELRGEGRVPKLVSILADNSPESRLYVSLKEKFSHRIGAIFEVHHFDGTATKKIVEDVQKANQDPKVQGIMVQLPVVDEREIIRAIDPVKDIDCLSPENLGLIIGGTPRFLPATVKAVVEIIKEALGETKGEKWLTGMKVCLIGASIIVGKPLAILLSDMGATVTICRSTTQNLADFTRQADILISATGVTDLIKKEMVKLGGVVIDVGICKLLRGGKFKVVGDVDPRVLERTAFFTPVPGGVGPVTVACLFENLLLASQGR